MTRLWLIPLLLACACGGLAPGVLETTTHLKTESQSERRLASLDDVEAIVGAATGERAAPGLSVTGTEGPLLAGVRAALEAAELEPEASVAVSVEANPPDPGGSYGEVTLAITLSAAWIHAPEVTRYSGTIRGPLTYRYGGGGDLAQAIGKRVGEGIAAELKRNTPAVLTQPRPPLTRAVEVAVGHSLACSRHEDGAVRCWGSAGQRIGAVPGLVTGLGAAVEIAAADDRACARLGDRTVRCWGSGLTDEEGKTPVAVCDVAQARAIALGKEQGCALLEGGEVRCWATQDRFDDACGGARSRVIEGVAGATAIAAGFPEACAILPQGQVTCWQEIEAPARPVPEIGEASALGVGFSPCALDGKGTLRCWTSTGLQELRLPEGSAPAIEPMHGCARTPVGELLCWEFAGAEGAPAVRKVEGLGRVIDADVGFGATCTVNEPGAVLCWGDALYGITGQRQDSSAPGAVRFVM